MGWRQKKRLLSYHSKSQRTKAPESRVRWRWTDTAVSPRPLYKRAKAGSHCTLYPAEPLVYLLGAPGRSLDPMPPRAQCMLGID